MPEIRMAAAAGATLPGSTPMTSEAAGYVRRTG